MREESARSPGSTGCATEGADSAVAGELQWSPGPPRGARETGAAGRGEGLTIVLGTRPEIVKLAPLVHELERRGHPFRLVHTGQHYSREMSEVFLRELGYVRELEFLDIGGGSATRQTARALWGLERIFGRCRPRAVLVEGDTNTVLAGALAAAQMGIPVVHLEAGLRSYDDRMPEERNRRLADHLSSVLLAPTKLNERTLRGERVRGRIHVTGNTVIDAIEQCLPEALRRSDITSRLGLEPGRYILATVHRSENVDDPRTLSNFITIFQRCPLPVVLPLHPRTRKMARRAGLGRSLRRSKDVVVTDPVGYMDFLALMKRSAFVLTDSGGVQEEVTAPSMRKKCFVLRTSTERPEAVRAGYCVLAGTEVRGVLGRVLVWWNNSHRVPRSPSPYGDGNAARRCADALEAEGVV
ncbi:MAG: UDP-N-acetylglucosamine 2-epimerase (non-hydrolyzing) [Thermoplasmata archaeon]